MDVLLIGKLSSVDVKGVHARLAEARQNLVSTGVVGVEHLHADPDAAANAAVAAVKAVTVDPIVVEAARKAAYDAVAEVADFVKQQVGETAASLDSSVGEEFVVVLHVVAADDKFREEASLVIEFPFGGAPGRSSYLSADGTYRHSQLTPTKDLNAALFEAAKLWVADWHGWSLSDDRCYLPEFK